MSMVTMALYSSMIPSGPLMAVRMFLTRRMSRVTVMRVRGMLSEIKFAKYGRPKWRST